MTQSDGTSAIDSAIFTEGDYTAATKLIDIYSEDYALAATYTLIVKVSYQSYPTVSSEHTFYIDVGDLCETSVSITPPALTSIVDYTIGDV